MTIDIKVQIELLKELQDIDIHIREIEEALDAIPQQIEEAKSTWMSSAAEFKAKEEEKAESEKQRRELEAGLEDTRARLLERENKLYAIKTNKEYQAALKEITDGKKANNDREEAILKLMEKNDVISKEIAQLSEMAAEKENEFRTDEEELKAKMNELEKEKDVRASELKMFDKKIDKEILDKYNFIRGSYLDPVAPVIKGICQGCNMNIPPQMYNELLKFAKILFCPNCRRFIYAEEEKEENSEDITNED